MLLSYTIVDFYFYYNNGAVNMQICTLLKRIQCKVSDTQVTVKACGPLVCLQFTFLYIYSNTSNHDAYSLGFYQSPAKNTNIIYCKLTTVVTTVFKMYNIKIIGQS